MNHDTKIQHFVGAIPPLGAFGRLSPPFYFSIEKYLENNCNLTRLQLKST